MSNEPDISSPYQVRLPVFEGPLDLLLHLIEREKLDISTVSLAAVTDQFLEYIQSAEALEAAVLADFLAMAARLICLKSRLLLPQPAKEAEAEEEDPGEALARQLREYKRFKEVAGLLEQMEASGRQGFVRVAPAPELERQLASCDVTLDEFLAAVARALTSKPPALPAGAVVTPFRLTIHDQIELIARLARNGQPVAFRSLVHRAQDRGEVIVTLLAVLELLKRRRISVEQSAIFGEITIVPLPGVEIVADDDGNGFSA